MHKKYILTLSDSELTAGQNSSMFSYRSSSFKARCVVYFIFSGGAASSVLLILILIHHMKMYSN